eukprot:TRINITY_DN7115_c0_g1_i1.p1 TRINITY_DN7115_c0_g1~~TRINITY_DN7115_c0_g1_i1.p1  ORF type:complete len:437 (+),score=44.72 TRINITY_DN7115_c0_g1_i1:268-1578(+)
MTTMSSPISHTTPTNEKTGPSITNTATTTVVTSAPGKLILFGEHAVVHGKKAIATSVGLRTVARFTKTEIKPEDGKTGGCVCLYLPQLDEGIRLRWTWDELRRLALDIEGNNARLPVRSEESFCAIVQESLESKSSTAITTAALRGVIAFVYLFLRIVPGTERASYDITVDSQLPTGAGLGSSASYCVALSSGLLCLAGVGGHTYSGDEKSEGTVPDEDHLVLVNEWALQAERIIHGNPSGIDNAVATFGGAMVFSKGKFDRVHRVPSMRLLITDTKVPRQTRLLVAGVGQKHAEYPTVMEPILAAVEAISERCLLLFENSSDESSEVYRTMKDLFTLNQHLLNGMGVGHQSLDDVVAASQRLGFGAKLTGAGGGGCAITLLPSAGDETGTDGDGDDDGDGSGSSLACRLREELQNEKNGFRCFDACVGGPGVLYL